MQYALTTNVEWGNIFVEVALKPVTAEFGEAIYTYRRSFQARLSRQLEARERARRRVLQAVRKKAPVVLSDCPSVHRAYLFGSVTRATAFHEESDVDIAVEGVTAQEYFGLWRALERTFPDWAIDLRDITPASPFADLVRKTGVLIYERTDSSATSRDSS